MRRANRFTITITLAGLSWAVLGLALAVAWFSTGSL